MKLAEYKDRDIFLNQNKKKHIFDSKIIEILDNKRQILANFAPSKSIDIVFR